MESETQHNIIPEQMFGENLLTVRESQNSIISRIKFILYGTRFPRFFIKLITQKDHAAFFSCRISMYVCICFTR